MGALLTLTEAARMLRMRDAEAVRWLDQRDLIHDIDGRPRVIEADVLAELRAAKPRSLPARRPLARATVSAGPEDRELAGARPRKIQHGDVTAHAMKRDGKLRREDGRYYWRARATRGGVQVTVWCGWATRAEADAAVHQAVTHERLVERGHVVADDELTVDELLDAWIEAKEQAGKVGSSSLRTYRSAANALKRWIGDRRVVEVTAPLLDRYVRLRLDERGAGRRRRGVKAAGLRMESVVWRMATQWAIDGQRVAIERVPRIPTLHYEPDRGSKAPPLPVLRLLFEHLDEQTDGNLRFAAAVLRFMLLTGARIAEAWAVRWEDIEDGWVTLRGKTGERRIPLAPRAARLVAEQERAGPRVLSTVGLSAFRRRVYDALAVLPWAEWESPPLRSHDFRAFFVERCYALELPVHVCSAMCGHSPRVALESYVRAKQGELLAGMRKLAIDELLEVRVVDLGSRRREHD